MNFYCSFRRLNNGQKIIQTKKGYFYEYDVGGLCIFFNSRVFDKQSHIIISVLKLFIFCQFWYSVIGLVFYIRLSGIKYVL